MYSFITILPQLWTVLNNSQRLTLSISPSPHSATNLPQRCPYLTQTQWVRHDTCVAKLDHGYNSRPLFQTAHVPGAFVERDPFPTIHARGPVLRRGLQTSKIRVVCGTVLKKGHQTGMQLPEYKVRHTQQVRFQARWPQRLVDLGWR